MATLDWADFEDRVRHAGRNLPAPAIQAALELYRVSGVPTQARVPDCVQAAGVLVRIFREPRRSTPTNGLVAMLPAATRESDRLGRIVHAALMPAILLARNQIFGQAAPPFPSLADAWQWATAVHRSIPPVP